MAEKYLFNEIEKETKGICGKIVENFLQDKYYNAADSEFLTNKLLEQISNALIDISPNFKYIINIVLLKDKTQGYTQNTQMYYNTQTDGVIQEEYVFPNIVCLLNIFILAI